MEGLIFGLIVAAKYFGIFSFVMGCFAMQEKKNSYAKERRDDE